MRMLALCTYEGVPDDKLPDKGLTLAGIVAIRDDVRPEAVEGQRVSYHLSRGKHGPMALNVSPII